MAYSKLCKGFFPARHYKPRTDKVIDTITIHHMAGNMTAKNCVTWLSGENSPQRSCNYAIGSDGEIWGGVAEEDEAYTSSSRENDGRAITIEVANDGGEESGWHVSDKAISSLVALLADICQRHPDTLPRLRWENNEGLIGDTDRQNITLHRWFAATVCPGPYLESQISAIVRRVNARLDKTGKPDSNFTQSEREEILNLFADFILGQVRKKEV